MTAIKTKEQQNQNAMRFLSTTATINNRRRHTYVGNTVNTSEVEINNWKQNAVQSQVST